MQRQSLVLCDRKAKVGKRVLLALAIVAFLALISLVNAQSFSPTAGFDSYRYVNVQYGQPTYSRFVRQQPTGLFWPSMYEPEKCNATQDFVLQILPGACQPAVVRSDLLEEQDVAVFCRIDALKLNPFLDVEGIKYIRPILQERNEYIKTIGYQPARVWVGRDNLLGAPILNNAGYLIIVLRRQPSEKEMPDWVTANITARIYYDAANIHGISRDRFVLPVLSKDEWQKQHEAYAFWNGKGYIRAEAVSEDRAKISIYSPDLRRVASFTVKKGELSPKIYLPGFYCRAALQVRLDDVVLPEKRAKLRVDDRLLYVYEGETFLDDKCRVTKIETTAYGGSVSISCTGNPRLELRLLPSVLDFDVGGEIVNVSIGEKLTANFSLAYIGLTPAYLSRYGLGTGEQKMFVVLTQGYSEDILEKVDSMVKLLTSAGLSYAKRPKSMEEFKEQVENETRKQGINAFVLVDKDGLDSIVVDDVEIRLRSTMVEKHWSPNLESVLGNAFSDYLRLADDYPQEEFNGERLGQLALERAALLAKDSDKMQTYADIVNRYKEVYGEWPVGMQFYGESTFVQIGDEFHVIRLESISMPSIDELSVAIVVSNATSWWQETAGQDTKILLGDKGWLRIEKIAQDKVRVRYECYDEAKYGREGTVWLELDRPRTLCGYDVLLKKVKAEMNAKITVIPQSHNRYTDTSLEVKIGIEKRALKLSPEKTMEMISNLNKSIEQWESINERLGKMVKGMKGACLLTSTFLHIKNLIEGFSGKAIARQAVMQEWKRKCDELVANGQYATRQQCLINKNAEIEQDVSVVANKIQEVNERIKSIEEKYSEKGLLGETIVNTEKAKEEYYHELLERYGDKQITYTEGGREKTTTVRELLGKLQAENLRFEQLRELDLWLSVKDAARSEVLQETALERIGETTADISSLVELYAGTSTLARSFDIDQEKVNVVLADKIVKEPYNGLVWQDIKGRFEGVELPTELQELDDETPVAITHYIGAGGRSYLQVLMREGNQYSVLKSYALELAPDGTVRSVKEAEAPVAIVYMRYGDDVYHNKYRNPVVRYYDTEPYRGLPALVPFDAEHGWYVATKQTLPAFGGTKAYYASGMPSTFWICNVGPNGREEFDVIGDDICRQFNLGAAQPIDQFPGLSNSEAVRVFQQAQKALAYASSRYRPGLATLDLSMFGFKQPVRVEPAVNVPEIECVDFMSPRDCQILFNVCDPVICPSSRCDFGGTYRVANVVQSGIFGSLVLCWPNYREGIYLPVCLTGLHAGIENYLSILRATRDCLQESLATGRNIGICDQIKSIYLCEFFWRQAAPFINMLIPKLIEHAYGQATRGGGEYLTVTAAWQNMEKSVDYFTTYYGKEAFEAFQARSIEQAGSTFCKAFVSTRFPTDIKAFVEPDSPPQFTAWFDEIPFSDATVPPTSHYKVFYHIYAGKDRGAYYSVYLRRQDSQGLYATPAFYVVDTGYIARGSYVQRSKDFTAPSGYAELCVRVNQQEECGFKQVSTSFALNYLRDKYIEEQATTTQITTESECIGGKPSPYGMLAGGSLQGRIEEAVMPRAYTVGVVRVCSTDNPGLGTDPSRWVDVGYCDNPKIRCWLDKKSVEEAITTGNAGLLNQTLAEIENISIANALETGMLSREDASQRLDEIRELIDELETADLSHAKELVTRIANKADYIEARAVFNDQKALALFRRGYAFELYARKLLASEKIRMGEHKLEGQQGGNESSGEKEDVCEEQGLGEAVGYFRKEKREGKLASQFWLYLSGKKIPVYYREDYRRIYFVYYVPTASFDHYDEVLIADVSNDGEIVLNGKALKDHESKLKDYFDAISVLNKSRLLFQNSGLYTLCFSGDGLVVNVNSSGANAGTETYEKSYEIKKIAFIVNRQETYDAKEGDEIKIYIKHNCDKLDYYVYSKSLLRDQVVISGSFTYDENSQVIGMLGKGKYVIRAKCLDKQGEVRDEETSEILVVL